VKETDVLIHAGNFCLDGDIKAIVEPLRYEYRVWSNSLVDLRHQLEQLATGSPARVSRETYLISTKTERCNLKIRAERLNLKSLLARENGLELWKPILDREFPLDRATITNPIFLQLKLKAPELEKPAYAKNDFVNKVIRAEPRIEIVPIIKKRARFRLDECLAEFTSVAVGLGHFDTVALESTRPDAALRLVRQLGITGMPNTSYIRQLKQILSNGKRIVLSDRRQRGRNS
jgi:hypothetical protein